MLQLNLKKNADGGLTVLCLGAHCDDIEIGCGGTLLYLKSAFPKLRFHWVVFSASGLRGQEAAKAAELFTAGCEKEFVLKDFRDGFLPYSGDKVKGYFEEMKGQVNPDVIFTHWQGDAHQDHRLISELTWNSFRNHLILEYEIPKYDGDMGRPNMFVPLEADMYQRKIQYTLDAFESQHTKRWFQKDTFLSLMRLRGMECNAPSNYAEAFHCRKSVLQF
ncbi:MAG: PIG-L deacetylase family protein [Candidatus Acidiferrales bacterium]